MSFNELDSVEHYIIRKLRGVNLNAADALSSVVKKEATLYETFRLIRTIPSNSLVLEWLTSKMATSISRR